MQGAHILQIDCDLLPKFMHKSRQIDGVVPYAFFTHRYKDLHMQVNKQLFTHIHALQYQDNDYKTCLVDDIAAANKEVIMSWVKLSYNDKCTWH